MRRKCAELRAGATQSKKKVVVKVKKKKTKAGYDSASFHRTNSACAAALHI